MPEVRPKGRDNDYPALEVSDDQVEFWESVGYVAASSGSTKKTASKRTAAKKSSK